MDATVSGRVWTPDTYIVNAKKSFVHDVTTKNGLLVLYPNGTVTYVLRITSQVRTHVTGSKKVLKLIFSIVSYLNQNFCFT